MFSVLIIACFMGNLLEIPQEQEQFALHEPGQHPEDSLPQQRVWGRYEWKSQPALPSNGSPKSQYVCAEVCLMTISTSHGNIFD